VAAVAAIEVTGAWLIAASGAGAGHLVWVSDEVSELLAELQLTLGEGPGLDAAAFGGPVLASDLGEVEAVRRWPVFAPAARQAGASAIFVFPLQVGAIRAGVMGLYRERPGPLAWISAGAILSRRRLSRWAGLGQRTLVAQPRRSKMWITAAEMSTWPGSAPCRAQAGSEWCMLCQLSPNDTRARGHRFVARS
jgi:hypothetical protein